MADHTTQKLALQYVLDELRGNAEDLIRQLNTAELDQLIYALDELAALVDREAIRRAGRRT